MTRLIGLLGPKNCGKDTVGKLFVQRGFTQLAFADPVKQVIGLIYDIPVAELMDTHLKEQPHANLPDGASRRNALQQIGTEVCRQFDSEVWIKFLTRRVMEVDSAVVTDVRFPNEAECIKRLGGIIVYVHRLQAEHVLSAAIASGTCHESELHTVTLRNSCTWIDNNTDKDSELYPEYMNRQLDGILARLALLNSGDQHD